MMLTSCINDLGTNLGLREGQTGAGALVPPTHTACSSRMRTAPSSPLMAQPNTSDSSLQALERRMQEQILHKEGQLVACENQLKAVVSEKLAADEQHVAQYNLVATE